MLRQHQQKTLETIDGIIAGSGVRKIILHAVPGSGKSLIPIIVSKLITAGLADAMAWIVPRKTLQDQGERGFLDPRFRTMLNHRLVIRSSTNDVNPCRGTSGFVTTYQAVAQGEKGILQKEFSQKRYILILDEFHHVELDGIWHKALAPLVERAAFLLLMTGTLERGDDSPIAFVPYDIKGKTATPKPEEDPGSKLITYSRTDALRENAILPLHFVLHDGEVEWEKAGKTRKTSLSGAVLEAGAAIWTAMQTEFAEELLRTGLDHWMGYKIDHPRSKVLIITANIAQAKKVAQDLRAQGLVSEIATSHDHDAAAKAIKKFKGRACDVLVSVAMVYEGFDAPAATHEICLTHIRSVPWIEQMVARVVRIDPYAGPYETQMGYIFAPDDFLMRKIILRFRAEQTATAKIKAKFETPLEPDLDDKIPDGNNNPFGIIPIGSRLTDQRGFRLGKGYALEFYTPDLEPTQSEVEKALKTKIEALLRAFSFRNYYRMERINTEIKAWAGKARSEMTRPELERLLTHVLDTYPGTSHSRGGGKRVPTRALPWRQSRLFKTVNGTEK